MRKFGGKKLFFVNFILLLIPLTYFGYQPLLRYSASILIIDSQPKKSGAIVVLSGGEPGRAWTAAELYQAKMAPYIVVSKDIPTVDEEELRQRGIELVDGRGNSIRVLRGFGVPEDRIITPAPFVEDTFDELKRIRELCEQQNWKSLILVTSNYHTRRTRLTAGYVLGSTINVTVVAANHGGLDRGNWWKNRADLRTFLIEFEKLVAYTLYIWPRSLF